MAFRWLVSRYGMVLAEDVMDMLVLVVVEVVVDVPVIGGSAGVGNDRPGRVAFMLVGGLGVTSLLARPGSREPSR